MLAHMMLCTTRASSSLKRFNSHAGTPSIPVAFLGFRCLSVHFTCLMEGKGGGTRGVYSSMTFDSIPPPPLFGSDYLPHKIIPNQSISHCLFTCQHDYINTEYELIS